MIRSYRFSIALMTSVAVLSLGLVACDSGGGGAEDANRVVPIDKPEGCSISPSAGAMALMGNVTATNVVQSRFFGKKYDRADLEAVLDASIVSTGEYVKALGVSLYKIKNEKPGCTNYYNLSTPPEEISKIWNEASGGDMGGGELAGLYFEACTGNCPDSQVTRPTILVNEKQNRWTLVHEMMHHNYNKERKADRTQPSRQAIQGQTDRAIRKLTALLKAYDEAPNRSDLTEAMKELETITQLFYRALVSSAFEEVANEGLLVDEYVSGKLKNVTAESAANAIWYMEYSRDKGMPTLRQVEEVLPKIRSEASRQFWTDIVTTADTTTEFVNEVEKSINADIASARTKLGLPMPSITNEASQLRDITQMLQQHGHGGHFVGQEQLDAINKSFDDAMKDLGIR